MMFTDVAIIVKEGDVWLHPETSLSAVVQWTAVMNSTNDRRAREWMRHPACQQSV